MGGPVEQAYIVSVEALEEICKNLSQGAVKYSIITACDPKEIVFSYTNGPDDLIPSTIASPSSPTFGLSESMRGMTLRDSWPVYTSIPGGRLETEFISMRAS